MMESVRGNLDGGHVALDGSPMASIGGGEADVLSEHRRAERITHTHVVLINGSAVQSERGFRGRRTPGEGGGGGDGETCGDRDAVAVATNHVDSSVRVGFVGRDEISTGAGGDSEIARDLRPSRRVTGRCDRHVVHDRTGTGGVSEFPDGLYHAADGFSVVPLGGVLGTGEL